MGFKIHFQNFQKPKIKLKKDTLKFQKLKTYIRRPQIKKFYKTGPPKVGILIQNTILKFSKTKNLTQKDPQKLQKIKKQYIRRPQIKKFYNTDPPKVGILISNTILKFSKCKNKPQKRPPKVPKNQKH